MDFLNKITKNTLLIIKDNLKDKILTFLNQSNKLINLKIMTLNEFNKHYFFDYDERTIYYLTTKYNFSVKNAKLYLDNIKYILNLNFDLEKITNLKTIYQDLKEHNLLKFDFLFKPYLENINLIVLNQAEFDPFYQQIFNNYQVSYENIKLNDLNQSIPIYNFKTIEEEVSFIFNQISSLLKKGVDLKKIKLMNVSSEYLNFLKRFSILYNIPIQGLEKNSIYGTILVKKILQMIKEKQTKEFILEYLNSFKDQDLYLKILNILNKYYFVNDLFLVYDLIVEEFKNTNLQEINYINSLEILPLNSYNIQDEYIFLMGFNLENIPRTYQDIDYLNDLLKEKIGLFTSLELNKLEKNKTIEHIKNIPNLIITYKETDPYKSYLPSNLLEDLSITYRTTTNLNTTSNLYNQIKLTNNFDLMLKYGTISPDTSLLFNTYKDLPYLKYDNTFKNINDFHLNKLTLSYTSLNNYYHCRFRYYIDNILKLNIYEDNFKIFIGNLFHFILSKMFEGNFNFDLEFNNFLKEKEFNKKELFYLKILKEELKDIILIIQKQHALSGLNKVKLEEVIKIKYQNQDEFKGIIDKIMYKEKDNKTYLSLIDYKTGLPHIDMTNLKYGIDMQLPIYVYLIKKSNIFLNPEIIGFYFEQILHERNAYDPKKSNLDQKVDNLKLNGYSINDMYLVNMFDESYLNSQMIKGMKVTSKGFSHYTKVLTEDEITNLVNIVDLKIKEAFKEIKNGNFQIDPKVINGVNIGCSFCSYQDLCFKTGSDLVYLEKENDLSYLGGNNAKLDERTIISD